MTQDQTRALVGRAPSNPADLLMWCTACPSEAADLIERQSRIIAAHEQQVKDGAELLAAKDAEIERLQESLRKAGRAAEYANDCFAEASAKLLAAESSLNAAVEMMNNAAAALSEATAILGGEYGDHYATLCDRMMQLDEDIASFRSRAAGGNET